jgi:hypothetical protein
VSIPHSKAIIEDFVADGVAAAHIDANTPKVKRKELIDAFRAGDVRILSSVGVLSVGFDVPDASCLILARPTQSEMLYIQQIGRGIRSADGKTDCVILDHAGNVTRFYRPEHYELPHELDAADDDPRNTKVTRDDRLVAVVCEHCGYVMDAGMLQCPACGLDRPRRTRQGIQVIEGDLERMGAEYGQAPGGPPTAEQRLWYLGARFYHEHVKGVSEDDAARRAWGGFCERFQRFGLKPDRLWRHDRPVPPSPEVVRFIKRSARNFARRASYARRAS